MALRRPPQRTLTAAGRRYNFADRRQLDALRSARPRWQPEAWDYYDSIGSVRWAMDQVARLAGRCQLRLGWYPQPHDPAILPEEPPVELTDAGRPVYDAEGELVVPDAWPLDSVIELADAVLDRIINGLGGPHELLSLGVLHLNVVGETWIIGRRVEVPDANGGTTTREVWSLHPGDAIEVQGDVVRVRLTDSTNGSQAGTVELQTAPDPITGDVGAFAARIWNRHPRYQEQATTTMRAVLEDCQELNLIRHRLRAVHRSHVSAGVLVVAQELNGPGGTPASGDEVEPDGEARDVAEDIAEALITPVNDEASDAGVVPVILTAPAELVPNSLKHVTFGRTTDATILTERDALQKSIAQGLPLPPEAVTGVGDVNHWTAWQVSEDTFRIGAAPPVETLLRGFSTWVLVEALVALGVPRDEAERVCCWYDPSDAIARPDPIEQIAAAFGSGVIDANAYRRYLPGITDDDAPSTDEIVLRILQSRGVLTAETTAQLIAVLGGPTLVTAQPALPAGDEEPVDVEPVEDDGGGGPEGPPPDGPPDGPDAGLVAAAGEGRARLVSERLGALERGLMQALLVAADAAVGRAVERVGARARTRAQRSETIVAAGPAQGRKARDAIAGLAADEVPRRLGRALVAALGAGDEDSIRAELAGLRELYLRLVGGTADEALELIATLAGDPEQVARVLAFGATYQAAVSTSADLFVDLLVSDTMGRLFDDVDLTAEQLGELDTTLRVSPGSLRRALAVAGGSDPAAAGDVGGLTGGPTASYAAAAAAHVRIGYEWVYGPGLRGAPFPPHRALDGDFFADWESPVLATAGTGHEWVGSYFHPGDHGGCLCDAQPVFRPVEPA